MNRQLSLIDPVSEKELFRQVIKAGVDFSDRWVWAGLVDVNSLGFHAPVAMNNDATIYAV